MKVIGSVEQKISPSWLGLPSRVNSIAEASDRGIGYMAFHALSSNPLAFLVWGILFYKVWFSVKS